jgi:hypothetical protein
MKLGMNIMPLGATSPSLCNVVTIYISLMEYLPNGKIEKEITEKMQRIWKFYQIVVLGRLRQG